MLFDQLLNNYFKFKLDRFEKTNYIYVWILFCDVSFTIAVAALSIAPIERILAVVLNEYIPKINNLIMFCLNVIPI